MTFLPAGDVVESSPSGWIYNSNPPLGQVILIEGTPNVDVVHPTMFTQLWTDTGSGATLNGTIWAMVPPMGFTALGQCCTFSKTGVDPAPPIASQYYCVASNLVQQGTAGPQIWNTEGSGVKRTSRSTERARPCRSSISTRSGRSRARWGPPNGVTVPILPATSAVFG